MSTYRVEKYAADGCGGPEDAYVIQRGLSSVAEARKIVRQVLGVRHLTAARKWDGCGPPCVEAYHDFPPKHPRADGCGGVSIEMEIED